MQKLDIAQIEQLKFFEQSAEEKLIDNLIQIFDSQYHEILPEMQKLTVHHENNQMSKMAHKLKSSAGQLGLSLVEKKCLELETQGRRELDKDFTNEISELNQEINDSLNELKQYLAAS